MFIKNIHNAIISYRTKHNRLFLLEISVKLSFVF